VQDAVPGATAVEQVRWVRRCWWDRRGFRHCRRVWRPGYFYGVPYRGPRIGLYWGGSRRHFRGGRHFRPRAFRGSPRAFRGRPPAFRGSAIRGSGFRSFGGGPRGFRGSMGGGGFRGGMGGGRMGGRR
jgi:hypothetical protein